MFQTDKNKGQPPKKVRREENATRDDKTAIIDGCKEKLEGRKKLPQNWICAIPNLLCCNLG